MMTLQNDIRIYPRETDQGAGVKMRRTHYQEEIQHCDTCHTPFRPRRPWQRFCSTPCRLEFHRGQNRHAILAGMIAMARALGYTKAAFIAKLDALWPDEPGQ